MNIFVGYGYNDRDKWVGDLVFRIIGAFDDVMMTGEELQGDQITEGVKQKIRQSDAMIGFLTKRGEPDRGGRWRTHRWVTDEIAFALSCNIPVLEVREKDVDEQGGIMGDRQHVDYDEKDRDTLLIDLVKTIWKWHQGGTVKLKLLPDACVQELFPLHRKQDLKCCYTLLVGGRKSPEVPTTLLPITGGLFVLVRDIPKEALIQLHIEYQGKHWISSFESSDALGIYLTKE
jgi:hypothetical protein